MTRLFAARVGRRRDHRSGGRRAKTIWETGERGHTDGLEAHPRDYEERVIAFFDRALLRP